MTVPIVFLLVLCVIYAVAHKGTDTPAILLGVSLGVYGAPTWIGSLTHAVVDGIAHGLSAIGR